MSNDDKISYHIDAGGETEIGPTEYKIAVLVFGYEYNEEDLRKKGEDFIDSEYQRLTQ